MTTAEALKHVLVLEDPNQDEAATYHIEATGSADRVHLTINPDLVVTEAELNGYRLRAAIKSVLEPFERYRRAMTRQYGSYAKDERLFELAKERAEAELEQLVQVGFSPPEPGTEPDPEPMNAEQPKPEPSQRKGRSPKA